MLIRPSTPILIALVAATFGCSDPPPTPPGGAAQVQLTPASSTFAPRTNCTAGMSGTYTYFYGNPDKSAQSDTGQERVVAGIVQNGKGLSVACTVKSLGGGKFSVSGTVKGTDSNFQGNQGSIGVNGTVTVGGPAAGNTAKVSVFSAETGRLDMVDGQPGCTFGPVNSKDDTDPLTGIVKEGAFLGDISCPLVGAYDSAGSGCDVSASIALEHCLTGKEED